MGELWQDLVEMLRRQPVLWVPVLVADLLSYLVNLGRNSVVRAMVVHQTTHHSALGDVVVRGPMTASAMESTTIVALLLQWISYFVRLLLYTGAFVATAALLKSVKERARKPVAEIGPYLQQNWGGILELALRALCVYAVAALLFSWLSPYLAKHGHMALVKNPWFDYGVTLLVPLALAVLLSPVAVRVLAGREPDAQVAGVSRQFALILVFVISVLSVIVSSNSRELAQVPLGARYPLEIIGSLLVALPYVLLFTGLALLSRRVVRENE